ncbi:SDR family oxidoreductase [Kibdelosporangium phytohabitans]|uniref:NAD-dependent dehydratase n=1 Tax=Kibdelosporangium phytohabitans TaxID=860235 RepID=A0A0N9HZG1_9PSEU|nr:SDR family oxidoreductase [Kibdelosporangium phytohabitans]ALG07581.1 NAD-dependent dehydratase [Kibdelosporangium phytohabitans]MBE1471475.1 nucleoside-diphosphate-sugar epimerase [Kibdelosporangium phytohabitans]
MEQKVAMVIGANGVIGSNLIDHLATLDDWRVIGVSRRGGQDTGKVRYVSADLLDPAGTQATLGGLTEATHVFYAAFQDRPTWSGLVRPNVEMLANVVDAVDPFIRHVNLMQGYKVYGAHLGPFKTPAREDDAGHMPPEFNVSQQELLEQRSGTWTWSALRPSVVTGFALGNPMNLAMVIAVYAAMSKELGLPLRFPGAPGAYGPLLEMTDAGLLAKAAVWAATSAAAANQAFNINNGDLFRWPDMWPRIARVFEMETAPPLRMRLEDVMADKQPLWDAMVAKHDLAPHTYKEVSSWGFGDFVFSWDYDFLADGSKARRLGFHEFVDTERMFLDIFADFRRRKVIP